MATPLLQRFSLYQDGRKIYPRTMVMSLENGFWAEEAMSLLSNSPSEVALRICLVENKGDGKKSGIDMRLRAVLVDVSPWEGLYCFQQQPWSLRDAIRARQGRRSDALVLYLEQRGRPVTWDWLPDSFKRGLLDMATYDTPGELSRIEFQGFIAHLEAKFPTAPGLMIDIYCHLHKIPVSHDGHYIKIKFGRVRSNQQD